MNENLTKICRICLTEGSRNIFQKTVANDALYNVSSLNRISEKLRYVTLLKVDEMENLPPMICDLCIVQLNVAYNFKRQATESDTKLRQYLIENGIDVMKDTRPLPAPSVAAGSTVVIRAITSARTNHRSNSTSSSSVLEVPANPNIASKGPSFQGRLLPIRIKVETPETVERLSESGDMLSNSTISPLSTVPSAAAVTISTERLPTVASSVTNSNGHVGIDSSPTSSKESFGSSGRDSAMVVVDSRNLNMQRDEDYVQNILGSNSSIATSPSKSAETEGVKKNSSKKKDTAGTDPVKVLSSDDTQVIETDKDRRLKSLLSSLTINMVTNSRFPKSKLRTKARKKLQKMKEKKQQKKDLALKKTSAAKPVIARRHSLDVSNLSKAPKKEQVKNNLLSVVKTPERSRPVRRNPNIISPSKLRTLGEKIREERQSKQNNASAKVGDAAESKRRKTTGDTNNAVASPVSSSTTSISMNGEKTRTLIS